MQLQNYYHLQKNPNQNNNKKNNPHCFDIPFYFYTECLAACILVTASEQQSFYW